MDLLLLGYGKMNRLVAEMAGERGQRVVKTVDVGDAIPAGWMPGLVAIEFSVPGAVVGHVEQCMAAGIPMVIGTTGWLEQLERVRTLVADSKAGAVYGANFSVGVAAFYCALEAASRALPPEYEAYVWEGHHRAKLDAPSGTAKRAAEVLARSGHAPVSVASTRAGAMPGTHVAGFDGPDDTLTITHTARSRRGFAAGALLAAEWVLGRTGLHAFDEVLAGREAGKP
ncbi:MAG: 4-hydroxy-tetrahydrodipicolinate reductase [Terriglobales bacterium]